MSFIDFENEMINFCQRLIKTPSIHSAEEAVANLIKHEMESLGYDQVWIDKWGNVVGKINASKPTNLSPIILDCHIDTVGVTDIEQWTYPPFAAELVEGKIYGRGAADMKGALAAVLYALAYLKKNYTLNRDIYLSGTVCEEIQEGVLFKKILDRVNPGLVIICEASSLNLKIGQRGRAEIVLETIGRSAHSSNPQVGVNAVELMLNILSEIKNIELPIHHELAPAIMEITDIHSEPYPGMSVIPDYCKATFDRRLMVGEEMEEVIAPIKRIIKKLQVTNPELQADAYIAQADFVTYTGERLVAPKFAPAWYFSKDQDFIQAALHGLKDSGLNPKIATYDFCTNGSMSAGFLNIPTIGFGPCTEDRAHIIDEFIYIDELISGASGYIGMLKKLQEVNFSRR